MKIENHKLRLVLCGKGELEDFILDAMKTDNRIIYQGFIPDEELVKIISKTNYFISPKLKDESFSKYSFPSKLIEYLVTGKPTISYDLPCIPHDYHPFLILLPNTTNALVDFLEDVMPQKQTHIQMGAKAKDFILKKKNINIQTKKITDFINSL